MLSLFIPANTSIGLAFLLVPIEFISYIFKPISLGVQTQDKSSIGTNNNANPKEVFEGINKDNI
jgi:hypothetical protein